MNHLTVATTLLLALALTAQSQVTSPRGFDRVEGDSTASLLGAYPDARYMTFDGEQIGNPMTITGVAYRADNWGYTTNDGMGRNWTSVSLHVAECDMGKLSATFSANPTTTPKLVFSGSITWPTLSGKPQQFPSDWIAAFPFSAGFAYSGNGGICLEYLFQGGTLANNAAWPPSTFVPWYTDSVDSSRAAYATSTSLGGSGANAGCNDRSVPHLYGAALSSYVYFYSDTYNPPANAGRLDYHQTGSWFGQSTQVLTLLGFRSSRIGVVFPGVYCNNLHVGLSLPTVQFTQFSGTAGDLPDLAPGGPYGVPAGADIAGWEIVTQAAWLDKVTKSVLFSSAATVVIPDKPRSFVHSVLHNPDTTSPYGYGPYSGATYNAIVRYSK